MLTFFADRTSVIHENNASTTTHWLKDRAGTATRDNKCTIVGKPLMANAELIVSKADVVAWQPGRIPTRQ